MRWTEEEVETSSLDWATLNVSRAFELASVSATEFTRHEDAFQATSIPNSGHVRLINDRNEVIMYINCCDVFDR
jgi:hypothetical protein